MATTELLTDPGHVRQDLAYIRQAIRNGWDIPEQLLSALPKIAGAMALDKKEKTANRLRAMETILKMKGQNDAQEPTPQQIEHHHTHNIGPVTEENIEAQRAIRLARLTRSV
jgi:hypothetical protein